MQPVHVDGGVIECGERGSRHWHAQVKFLGQEQVLSCACNSAEEAEAILQFARDVIHTMVNAMGGTAVLADSSDVVQ